MSKTPEEIYNEIKKEIWQINESYTRITDNRHSYELNPTEKSHCAFLHDRLKELVERLNENKPYSDKPGPSLVYKKMVNLLLHRLYYSATEEYRKTVKNDVQLESLLDVRLK